MTSSTERKGFTCPECRRTSYHPDDVRQGYCGACHDWTGRCELTELLIAECGHCIHPERRTLRATTDGKWTEFRANYAGKCADCGDWYAAGDQIARLPDGGGYLCPDCTQPER